MMLYRSTITSINPSSATASDGYIIVNVLGGTPPYSMFIDDGSGMTLVSSAWQSGDTIQGLSVGIYALWVMDGSACDDQDTVQLIYNDCSATLDTIGNCPPFTLSAQTTNLLSGSYSYTYNLYFEGVLIEVTKYQYRF